MCCTVTLCNAGVWWGCERGAGAGWSSTILAGAVGFVSHMLGDRMCSSEVRGRPGGGREGERPLIYAL